MRIKMVLGVLFLVGVSSFAFAASDFQFTLNNTSGIHPLWSLTSVSDPSLFSGSLPATNPTINLVVGKRYGVTVVNSSFHIFQVLAKGATFATDTILLSAIGTGTFQTDPGVNWVDNGAATNELSEFTLTPALFAAMQGPGQVPGFRCGVHFMDMRGNFAVTQAGGDPAITLQPVSRTIDLGATAVFTVTASGTPPLSFQWQKDAADLPNATNSQLVINPVQLSDAGSYVCVARNAIGSTPSDPAILTVSAIAPAITLQPVSRTIDLGATAVFTVTASGTPPISFQWQKDAADLPNATNSQLVINPVQLSDAGSYVCVARNAIGSTPSDPAVLTVSAIAPAITLQPVSRTIDLGATAVFTVTASGTPPLSFQWQKDAADLPNATNSQLVINPVQLSDAGSYVCVARNAIGSTPSDPAILTVSAIAPAITLQPVSRTIDLGATAVFTVTASGTPPISFQWQKDAADLPNATNSQLVINPVQLSDAGSYVCVGRNAIGSTPSDPAILTVSAIAPAITLQPVSRTIDLGATAVFTVTASGTPPLSFQWQKDAADLPNATNSQLVINPVQLSDAGSYVCVARNAIGSTPSDPAILTVSAIAPAITLQPVSRTIDLGATAVFTVTASGTPPISFQWQKDAADLPNATNSQLVINPVQLSDAGSYVCVARNAIGSTPSDPATLVVGTAPVITTQPVSQTVTQGTAASFVIAATGSLPLSYQWRKDTVDIPGATTATFDIASAQNSDAGSYACVVTNVAGSATSSVAILTVNPAAIAPVITTQPVSQTIDEGASATFTVAASGTSPLSYQWTKNGVDISGAVAPIYTINSAQPSDAGSYACRVTNAAGSATSDAATLTVSAIAPAITTQPTSLTVDLGTSAVFAVTASGTPPLSFQWQKNTADISGKTGASLDIAPAQLSDEGSYRCIVTNAIGSATSDAATLTVSAVAPAITLQPTSLTVGPGTVATFVVTASGTPPLSFQWQKNTADISGKTGATLQIFPAQFSDQGSYRCVVTNAIGSATSDPATLIVGTPPAITTQPASQTVTQGTPASFVIVATGDQPLSYQWRKDAADIPAATNATYSIASAQTSDAGSYACVVTDVAGSATSSVAILTVTPAATAPVITTQPVSQTVGAGASATFTVEASGTSPLSYQWTKDGVDISGAVAPIHTINSAQPSDAGSYACRVTNAAGSATSDAATLTIATAPTITTQPVSQTVTEGTPASFTVVAAGKSILSYQWQKDGGNLAGGTDATFAIAAAQTSDAGSYACMVSNAVGSTLSNPATLTVTSGGPPVITLDPLTQTANPGDAVSLTVAATGTPPLSYQWLRNGVDLLGAIAAVYDIYSVALADAGDFTCTVTNALGAATSEAAALTVAGGPTPPLITTQPVSLSVDQGAAANFSVTASGTPPLSYQWLKNGLEILGAVSTIYPIASAQPADAGSFACVVTNSVGLVQSHAATLTIGAASPPVITQQPASVTVNQGQPTDFTVAATGTPPLSYQWLRNGLEILGAVSSIYPIASAQPADAGSYTCTVSNAAGSVTSDAVTLTVNVPPVITSQPVSLTVNQGAPATFTVAATGSPPPVYQWQKDGVPIDGATAAALSIAAAQASDAASYTCVVSNVAGSVTSNAATLTVNTPPIITLEPVSLTVNSGAAATFTVAATGTLPLLYQWQKNGADIAGATLTSYSIASAQASDAASYACVVSNVAVSVTSNPATLTVAASPVITTQPVSRTVNQGAPATFTVAAAGTLPLSYQWQKNGADIAGATATALNIAAAQASDAASYACVVSNVAGSVTSNAATLTVNAAPIITVEPVSVTVNSGAAATFTVAATGTLPLSYQWQKNGAGIAGATLTTYSVASAQASDAASYACVVSNAVGSVTSNAATLTVAASPVITTQPVSKTVNLGAPASFTVAASGAPPLSYQWRKDGVDIAQARSATYAILSAQASSRGSYQCVVSNAFGSVTSDPATLTLNCTLPVAPGDVQATQGKFTDRVEVTWSPVTDATAYKVFRDSSATSTNPQLLDTVASTETVFEDTTAQAPTQAMGAGPLGCFEHTQSVPVKYFYFVEAVSTCGESALSVPSQGWRGKTGCDDKSARTRENVLPARIAEEEVRLIQPDSSLFIRLESADGVDVASVWGTVVAPDRTSDTVSWLPVGEGGTDGWVAYAPDQPWRPGDVVSMSVGATTVTGYVLGPVTYRFQVEPSGASGEQGVAVPQPDPSALDVSGLGIAKENYGAALVTQVDAQVAPPLAEGIGPLYALEPEAAYEAPQHVWLPLPAGADANNAEVYYYHASGSDQGWYPAANVEGWVVPGSYMTVDLNGVTYFGFTVRHSGIVQLAEPGRSVPAAPAAASAIPWDPANAFGDVLTIVILLTALVFVGKLMDRRRQTA